MARSARRVVLVITGALVLGGCSSSASTTTTTSPAKLAALGQQFGRNSVPWSAVGAGWLLALWGPNPGYGAGPPPSGTTPESKTTTTVFLIDPQGGRYHIANINPPADYSLASWSGDGRRALFSSQTDDGRLTLRQLNLETGVLSPTTTLTGSPGGVVDSVMYTKPFGRAVLATENNATATRLARFGLDGTLQQQWPSSFSVVGDYAGSALSFPDGRSLVLGAQGGVAVATNAGSIVRQISMGRAMSCTPMRWWAQTIAVVNCLSSSGTNRVYQVATSSGAVTAMTAPPTPPDYGDINAFEAGTSTYVQSLGGCGFEFVSVIGAAGKTSPITIPGVDSSKSTFIVTSHNNQLALHATVSCGSGTSLLWFNPATKTSTVVLGPPLNGGGVIAVLPYPSPSA